MYISISSHRPANVWVAQCIKLSLHMCFRRLWPNDSKTARKRNTYHCMQESQGECARLPLLPGHVRRPPVATATEPLQVCLPLPLLRHLPLTLHPFRPVVSGRPKDLSPTQLNTSAHYMPLTLNHSKPVMNARFEDLSPIQLIAFSHYVPLVHHPVNVSALTFSQQLIEPISVVGVSPSHAQYCFRTFSW